MITFGEAQADDYYWALIRRFDVIAEQPFLYPPASHIKPGYRRSVCGTDVIYYRMNGDVVEIMRILGRQDTQASMP